MIQWMKEHKYIVIGVSVVIVVLVAAFFLGGPKPSEPVDGVGATTQEEQHDITQKHTESEIPREDTTTEEESGSGNSETQAEDDTASTTTTSDSKVTDSGSDTQATATEATATDTTTANTTVSTTEATTEATTQAATFSCSITISCSDILNHMDNLKPEKAGLIPANGVILSTTVTVTEGETVMDALRRACSNSNVVVDASSGYVRGIQNIYERDCGTTSGWMYCVNGVYPNYGAASYVLKEGDSIQWNYSCSE